MRCSLILTLLLLLAAAAPAPTQIGKRVPVMAGSPEDKALAEINSASGAQKLALIDKFQAEYGKEDMAIVAYELYISYYQGEKNYDKVAEYAEKVLGADPVNLAAGMNLVRAAQEKGDVKRLFAAGERVAAILARYRAMPAPEGTEAPQWEEQKARAFAEAQDNINYVQYTLFSAGYQTSDPSTRAALLERFAEAFPGSPYTANAQALVAAAYQQAQNFPKMLEYAQRTLARDPSNLGMLILLSDYFSERGEQLEKAEEYAKKALELLGNARKPEGVAEDQWQKQVTLQKGLALTALGQVHIYRKRDAQAVEAFRSAGPLLKSDAFTYARNQYRLGFALLNLKRVAEARAALTEAAAIDSPYRALAQEKLRSLPAGPAKKRS